MSATLLEPPVAAADPFHIGYRFLPVRRPDGTVDHEQVPLTPADLLNPQEGDFVATPKLHNKILGYLSGTLELRMAQRPRTIVFSDHLIDWEVPGMNPLAPDIALMLDTDPWPERKAIYKVKDMGAETAFVLEVTSPSTRDTDLNRKVKKYWAAKVPLYVIVDLDPGEGDEEIEILAYRYGTRGPEMVVEGVEKKIWLPGADVWLVVDGTNVRCLDESLTPIGDLTETARERDAEKQRAEHEKQRAEHEKQRAEHEKQRAEHEKQRADSLQAELALLRSKIAQPYKNGHN